MNSKQRAIGRLLKAAERLVESRKNHPFIWPYGDIKVIRVEEFNAVHQHYTGEQRATAAAIYKAELTLAVSAGVTLSDRVLMFKGDASDWLAVKLEIEVASIRACAPAPTATAATPSAKPSGRPRIDGAEAARRTELLAAWDRAKTVCVSKTVFCEGLGITEADLDRVVSWHHKRR